MAVAALGVIRTGLAVLSFASTQFDKSDGPKVAFNFYIGSDGAKDPDNPNGGSLSNAGGNLPDIRIWEDNADFIKIQTNDKNKCEDGSVVCKSAIEKVEVQPTYTLFTANNDAMCIAYATVNFPGDTSKYATTLGGWAKTCSDKYEGRGGSWYWSDIYVQPKDGSSFKTECAWIDADGDQPTTGISLHWPEFDGSEGVPNGTNAEYFCNNNAVLQFHTEKNPSGVNFWTRKRNLFSRDPSVGYATTPADAMVQRQKANEAKARRTTSKHARSLVKSRSDDHSAKELCEAKTSAGPSFVSFTDRQFCHMETKTLYPLCEDVETGACFDDETNTIKALGNAKREALPNLEFTKVTNWS
ncbi:hypothetical protein F4820DRAFT_417730 [Hypoxylon rubiginosum]|uniref:Uncharacterized protein n=1 Tax=Hypoxylon rubiginosum TaxID=110542 RepID=A0ACB9Z3I0_9PEZI|nr:hypothetical protein F4820DRAFT_417730 [Hypoxylon rubiginosum]